MSNGNTIIAFFSRRGENLNVGSVEKGSGEIIASMLSSMMGAPGYQIRTENGYPDDLAECNRIAKKELEEGMRPALKDPLPDMDGISNLILVYPNWWGNLPMAVYTFLDSINTEGLSIYPVCTHEDNGLAMTERILAKAYPKADVKKGIALRGSLVQKDPAKAEEELSGYISQSGLNG